MLTASPRSLAPAARARKRAITCDERDPRRVTRERLLSGGTVPYPDTDRMAIPAPTGREQEHGTTPSRFTVSRRARPPLVVLVTAV